jgi:predicted RNA polymerase sigma factor
MSEQEKTPEPEPEKTARPEGLPAHFATAEALAASYKESYEAQTRKSQECAELAREVGRLGDELEGLLAERASYSVEGSAYSKPRSMLGLEGRHEQHL